MAVTEKSTKLTREWGVVKHAGTQSYVLTDDPMFPHVQHCHGHTPEDPEYHLSLPVVFVANPAQREAWTPSHMKRLGLGQRLKRIAMAIIYFTTDCAEAVIAAADRWVEAGVTVVMRIVSREKPASVLFGRTSFDNIAASEMYAPDERGVYQPTRSFIDAIQKLVNQNNNDTYVEPSGKIWDTILDSTITTKFLKLSLRNQPPTEPSPS